MSPELQQSWIRIQAATRLFETNFSQEGKPITAEGRRLVKKHKKVISDKHIKEKAAKPKYSITLVFHRCTPGR